MNMTRDERDKAVALLNDAASDADNLSALCAVSLGHRMHTQGCTACHVRTERSSALRALAGRLAWDGITVTTIHYTKAELGSVTDPDAMEKL